MEWCVFFEDGQSASVNESQDIELVEIESTVGEEIEVTPRPQNADCIGIDNSDQPDDVREPESHTELSTSSAVDYNSEGQPSNSGVDCTSRTWDRFHCSWENFEGA